MHCNGIATRKNILVQDDVSTASVHYRRKQNSRMACSAYQIAENPCRRLDVQVERKIAPVCVPIRPQRIPNIAGIELPQIDQTAHQ